VVTNFVQFQTTNICYNSGISSRTSLSIYVRRNIGPAAGGPAATALEYQCYIFDVMNMILTAHKKSYATVKLNKRPYSGYY